MNHHDPPSTAGKLKAASGPPRPGGPVLDYRSAGRRREHGRGPRITMLVAAVMAIGLAAVLLLNPYLAIRGWLGAGTLGTPFAPIDPAAGDDAILEGSLPTALGYLALFLFMQWLLLTPRGRWRIGVRTEDPLPRHAAIAAGFIGMLLSAGLLATLLELPDWWLMLTTEGGIRTRQRFGPVWAAMLLLWAFWSVFFGFYWRSLDRYTAMHRVMRCLVAGTVLELVIAAPAHAMIVSMRGDECYCQRGTWTGVAFGATSALWLFGPAAMLLFMREYRRRQKLI